MRNVSFAQKKNIEASFAYFVLFILIHGEMIFNKLSWHDDVAYLRGWNDGIAHGRFLYTILSDCFLWVAGIESLPVVNAVIVAVCVVLIGRSLIETIGIRQEFGCFVIMLICISLPAICGSFGYMASAGIDFVGALLAVLSACIIAQKFSWKEFVVAALLLAFSLGIYQCYASLFLSVSFCLFLHLVLCDDCQTEYCYFQTLSKYVLVFITGLFLYVALLQVFLWYYHTELATYAHINSYGITTLAGYIRRLSAAYKDFFSPMQGVQSMFPFHWRGWHKLLLLLLLFGFGACIIRLLRKHEIKRLLLLAISAVAMPAVINFNYILYSKTCLHSLHQYQYVCFYVTIVILLEKGFENIRPGERLVRMVYSAIFIGVSVMYIRYTNLCYLDAEVKLQQAFSYYTVLQADIYKTEGFSTEMPVAFVNGRKRKTLGTHTIVTSDTTMTNPYNTNPVTSYDWQVFFGEWCNVPIYNLVDYDSLSNEAKIQIEQMPQYPDYGSVKVIDGVLVVNF